ncbi:outer membrane beta-barrel protein [Undibacterium griseum]|uniref:Outer membrane beta-barrel protein n=1 Tax=Undibacterium griseum TaxID=2762295 RepID=A0ABR6YLB8_9BURK|nr:outer membrane beta-barrel protein [Undibacterium griseum]MBC3884575.1 outer membrane beta-barrel protein [Undibacterium griseum]
MLRNKIILAGLMAVAMVSGSAFAQVAQVPQVYMGATVGKGQWSDDCKNVVSCSTNSDTYKVFGGYNIDKNFAVEASYFSLGTISANSSAGGVNATSEVKGKGFELAGLYKHEFTQQLSGFAKLGIASIKAEGSGSVAGVGVSNGSTTSTQPVFGLGATYQLTKELALRGEFETRKIKFNGDKEAVNNVSVGLQYSF